MPLRPFKNSERTPWVAAVADEDDARHDDFLSDSASDPSFKASVFGRANTLQRGVRTLP